MLGKYKKINTGFTIVELLIVIVIIGIVSALVIIAYNGIQQRAADAKRTADINLLDKTIRAARESENKTLFQIFGSGAGCAGCPCRNAGTNPSLVEPKELPKINSCWTVYYDRLNKIAAAAGANLDGLKAGDPRGNPYYIDENEGEAGQPACARDTIASFTGNGVSTGAPSLSLPQYIPC